MRGRSGTPAHVYSGALIDERYRALDARVRGRAAPAALRHQGQRDARRRPRGCARSAPAPTPTPAARSRSPCAPASRPADIVFTGVGKTRAELERAVGLGVARDQRRVAGRS